MHYIIDGYNLMFRLLRAGDDLQSQRQTLIKDLSIKAKALHNAVTIVFDAQYKVDEGSRLHLHNLEIHFTDHGETADDYIVKLVKKAKNPANITVVTSDKKLSWLVRLRNAKTEPVDDFLKWLNNKYKNRNKQKVPVILAPLPVKKEIKEPHSLSSKEECFDFYLDQFEKNYQEILAKTPAPQEKQKKQKTHGFPKKEKQKKDPNITDSDRWLKAFERNLSDEDLY